MENDIINVLVENDYTDQEAVETMTHYGYLAQAGLDFRSSAKIIMEAHMEDLDAGVKTS